MILGRIVLVGCGFAIVGCGPSPTDQTTANVKLTVLASSYARTDTIKADLKNGLGTDVAYATTQCPGFLIERQVGSAWQATDSTPPRACATNAILFALRAGQEQRVITQPIHDWMPDGEYRFTITVQPNGGRSADVTSNTFRVGT